MAANDDPLTAPPLPPPSRKTFWRSASWSASNTNPNPNPNNPPLTPRSQKSRSLLPPLSIARRSFDEWPTPGSDDLPDCPHPPTPSSRSTLTKPATHHQMSHFDNECSKVADHVFLGGNSVARNREILLNNGITHVLNCVGFVCPEYFRSDFMYKTLWLQDSPSEDIISILYDVFDYFEDVRLSNGRVFVHCCQGVSRSTSLVIAYLMWRKGQSFDDAFTFVKSARGIANPNMGFACQLLQCQKRVLAIPMSPSSVLRMYRMAPHSSYDPLHLVPKMVNEPKVEDLDSRGAFIVHGAKSIYVWVGKDCDVVMEKDAKAAASQVVRYEKVSGPIITVDEGDEPSEFWIAFSNSDKVDESKVQFGGDKLKVGKKRVESYDVDFELFYKAITGGIVPPFRLSDPGQETHLPARENNWSVLRRKFSLGTIYRVYSDSAFAKDFDLHGNRVQTLSTQSAISPSNLSPSSISSDSSASSKCCSDSPSISPSTCSTPPLTPLSNLPESFVPQSKLSIQINHGLEPSKPYLSSICSPSKGLARSIAERRGSFSLKLPLNKAASLSKALSPSVEIRLDIFEKSNGNNHTSNDGSDNTSKCGRDISDNILCKSTELVDINLESSIPTQLLVYRWPEIEKLANFSREDLDSKAVLMFLTPNTSRVDRKLYLWVGCSVEEVNGHRNLKDVDGGNETDWTQVGCDFLAQMGLPKNFPVKVIKDQEPEMFIQSLTILGFIGNK